MNRPLYPPVPLSQRRRPHAAGDRALLGMTPTQLVVSVVSLQFLCQLGLLLIGDTPYRLALRTALFGMSVALLVLLRPARDRHPSAGLAMLVMCVLALGLLNPGSAGPIPAVGAIVLNLAIVAPLFWASGLQLTTSGVRTVLMTIWLFQSASAMLGVLQVQFPGRFEFALSAVLQEQGQAYLSGLQFTLASGDRIYRPMGLTDTPGGAATAGLISSIIALGLIITSRRPLLTLAAGATMLNGLFCIYVSHVRSVLVMLMVCVVALLAIMVLRGRGTRQLFRIGAAAAIVFTTGTMWAFAVGGEEVVARVATLFSDDPRAVYMRNRGGFLMYTIYVAIPEFPFGAGLGRWGMVSSYLGRFGNGVPPLWAEIQWTGWVFDGGVPLVILYGAAVVIAVWWSFKAACDRTIGPLADWSAVLFGYNMAALAVTFNYPLFIGQGGMEFWLLNSILFAAVHRQRALARARP